ncbi:GntR family transcriptional regulator [Sporolactobacillus shoreicorticis]|uniref:GntR family transcriptional regulator n=1 Tax=Sporolactobacillus shoreicorticis TaxID=1923877 RepID=A0ABW5S092_9BACL|nr:GntR family transcriptional regulator [Sporolactobacillus shoreicorticis]MCO7124699.1 GntR family transcriptional regulator [Sporolactobacillus shoreicorticis]
MMIVNQQEYAYREIRDRIMNLIYEPGVRISLKQIENDISVGRTPVREALIRLGREGVLETFPQRGTYISKIDLHSAINARYIREHIEQLVVMEATVKLTDDACERFEQIVRQQITFSKKKDHEHFFEKDEDFHRTFYEITDKLEIWDWLQILNTHLNRFRWLRLRVKELQWEKIISQHVNLLKAVSEGDVDEAKFLTSQHLHMMINEKQVLIDQFPDYFIDRSSVSFQMPEDLKLYEQFSEK